jgi:hypothetical protein
MKTMPKYLYRYQSLRSPYGKLNLERLLLHNEAYFPSPLSFNDPFDCLFPFSVADLTDESIQMINKYQCEVRFPTATPEEIDGLIQARRKDGWDKGSPAWKKWQEDCLEKAKTNIRTQIGVVCFSEFFDDILMWGHYADGHRGVCIQFRHDILAKNPALLKVEYRAEYPSLNDYAHTPSSLDKMMITTKADKWAYEQEWRLVFDTTTGKVFRLPDHAVSSVILGCEMPADDEKQIRDWLVGRADPLPIVRTEKDSKKFGITIPGFAG